MASESHTHQPVLWWKSHSAQMFMRIARGRFTALTIVVVGLAICSGLIQDKHLREIIDALAFSALLFFAYRSVGPRVWLTIMVFALPALLGHWSRLGIDLVPVWLVYASSGLFLASLTMVVLISVLLDEAVSSDTLVGALCVYFLIGATWGTMYATVEVLSPGSFSVVPTLATAAHWDGRGAVLPLLQYYSFCTLSTLGLGDLTPVQPAARLLTVLEGMTGQIYLAVLIARLVGIHSAHSSRR